ncbi:hypothetical protein [Proteiniphilum sp. X52]|uniref:hypothetical protein n=1 Tax=Proteiniphilum sp. X52 TaxID=2382159 RepID=UPI001629C8AD|nr:hypothetical protein [Proteiniphilum sp. X52]
MQTKTHKSLKYWHKRTLIAAMIGYAFFYFVWKNLSFAIPGLSAEYGITKTRFGIITTRVKIPSIVFFKWKERKRLIVLWPGVCHAADVRTAHCLTGQRGG